MNKSERGKRAAIPHFNTALCLVWTSVFILAMLLTACSYLRPAGSQPKAQFESRLLSTNGESGPVTIRSLQIEVMRFADNYAAVVARAADEFNARTDTPEARLAATKWKLEQATAAYIDASGPNPIINALDMVVLATASRMVMEDALSRQPFGEAAAPLLDTHHKLETNAWTLVSSILKPDQQQELTQLIAEWRRNNPYQRNVAGLRFREFMSAVGKAPERASSSPTSLFSLLFLDPMASMDPTTAAIEETRNTAERAMYYTQRMPTLLNWQVELLTYELAVQPETKQLLADTARFSKSSAAFAGTAEQLPKLIREEREAAIKQVLEGLVPEEQKVKAILADARALATEARETLKVGGATADSINGAIQALDQFVCSVSKTDAGLSTNARPYDVLDYAAAAREIGGAAKDLNTFLVSANNSASRVAQLREQTTADARALVDHALGRALGVVLALIGSTFLAAIIYRVAVTRLALTPLAAKGIDCQK